MTRYPRQVDREYLSCRSGGLDKIQMIDGGTLDLHQDLVTCDRRHRYIVEHQLPTIFQQSDSFHASSPKICLTGATRSLVKTEPAASVGLYALCRSAFQSRVFAQDSKSWKTTSGNSRRSAARSTAKPTRSTHSYILTASSPMRWRTMSSGTW